MPNNKSVLSVIKTADGSNTIFNNELNEHYHSHFGALQESLHVFIKNGLQFISKPEISILEVGLGTGLNVALTLQYCKQEGIIVDYTALEPFPLSTSLIAEFASNYEEDLAAIIKQISEVPFNVNFEINNHFKIQKLPDDAGLFSASNQFDIVYFDAFAPTVQPELWTQTVFANMYNSLKAGGLLTTYCAKGDVKRAMKAAGFNVKNLPGPPGKREMTIALKS